MPDVRAERTGWRDEGISRRHRQWGLGCPAVDIDFLLVEYTYGRPAALVEYKNERAAPQVQTHPSYRALIVLANASCIPIFAVRYADDYSWWKVTPLNEVGRHFVPERVRLTEDEWVTLLYRIRGNEPTPAAIEPSRARRPPVGLRPINARLETTSVR